MAGAALLGAACAGAADATSCTAARIGLGVGAEHSRWQERDANGRRLLTETGTLSTLSARVGGQCVGLDWQVELAATQGSRDYDGHSSTGAPLQTRSRIARQQLHLQALRPVDGGWSVGARLAHRWLQRDLQGVGAVQGYDERFATWQAATGLVMDRPAGTWAGGPMAWQAGLWLGGGPAGRMRLQLPQTDAATLRLGASRLVELHLGLCAAGPAGDSAVSGCAPAASGRWRVDLVWQHEQVDAGPPTVLRRQGVLVGGAAQPSTVQRALGLQAVLAW